MAVSSNKCVVETRLPLAGVEVFLHFQQTAKNKSTNTSTIYIELYAVRTYSGSISCDHGNYVMYLTVNGEETNISFPVTATLINGNAVTTLGEKEIEVEHDVYGNCTVGIRIGAKSGNDYYGQIEATEIYPIDRSSTLTVAGGTLGVEQTLNISAIETEFKSTVRWTCGTETGTLLENDSASSKDFTLPISLAAQNTEGTTVAVTFSIETLYNSITVGSVQTYEKTFAIPESVKPTCALSISDATGVYAKFNKYIEKASKFVINVTPSLAYGSEIVSYEIKANGATYTAASVTTDTLKNKGAQTITATVIDRRGRSDTATVNIDVAEYPVPQISSLKVLRCKSLEDGTEDITGGFAQVTFSVNVDDLTIGNTPTYTIEYKKVSESEYTTIAFDELTGNYSVTGKAYRFIAADSSPYIVRLIVDDGTAQATKVSVISTAEVLEHWHKSGRGLSFGKISEIEGLFDIGYLARFMGGFLPVELAEKIDLNSVTVPNNYVGGDIVANGYVNCPIASGTFGLEVVGVGTGIIKQVFHVNSKANPIAYARVYDSEGWGDWVQI